MFATPDDRGRHVRPFRPGLLLLLRFNVAGRRPTALPHAVCKRGLIRCGSHPWVVTACIVSYIVGVAAFVATLTTLFGWLYDNRPPASFPYLFGLLGGGVVGGTTFVVMAYAPRLAWNRWVDEIVGNGHCPSCGHPLAGLPVESDARTVCPECGAAWRPRSSVQLPTRIRPPGSGWWGGPMS